METGQSRELWGYDVVMRDMFQHDRPTLLGGLTGGLAAVEFLNVELPKVLDHRADLVLRLSDDSIFHLEFQSYNDREMIFREAMYCIALARRYRKRIRQTVLYLGEARARMQTRRSLGKTIVEYDLVDIRDFDSQRLLESPNPSDQVLALLAGGGHRNAQQIIDRLVALGGARRQRALAQLLILSGLRGMSRQIRMEVKRMGVMIDITKNEFLLDIRREGIAEGKAELMREMLEARFGRLPRWAAARIAKASPQEFGLWAQRVVAARTLEEAIGRR